MKTNKQTTVIISMWNRIFTNRICYEFSRFESHKKHLDRLLLTKSLIDNNGAKTPEFLSKRLSNKRVEKDYKAKISHENKVIFNKILEYTKKKSPYSQYQPNTYANKSVDYCSAFNIEQLKNRKEKSSLCNKILFTKPCYFKYINDSLKNIEFMNPNLKFLDFQKFSHKLNKELLLNKRVKNCKFWFNNSTTISTCKSNLPSISYNKDKINKHNKIYNNNNKINKINKINSLFCIYKKLQFLEKEYKSNKNIINKLLRSKSNY